MFCQSTICLFYKYALTKLLKNVSQVVSVSYKKKMKLIDTCRLFMVWLEGLSCSPLLMFGLRWEINSTL